MGGCAASGGRAGCGGKRQEAQRRQASSRHRSKAGTQNEKKRREVARTAQSSRAKVEGPRGETCCRTTRGPSTSLGMTVARINARRSFANSAFRPRKFPARRRSPVRRDSDASRSQDLEKGRLRDVRCVAHGYGRAEARRYFWARSRVEYARAETERRSVSDRR